MVVANGLGNADEPPLSVVTTSEYSSIVGPKERKSDASGSSLFETSKLNQLNMQVQDLKD